MHQPLKTPRQSLYFDYRVHPFVRPPEMAGQPRRHRVCVLGAGPIGLVQALALAQHGVDCVLLTSDLQVSEGSRAIVFTRRSLEILQQVGVGEQVAQAGLAWRFGNSFYRDQAVYRMALPRDEDDRFAPLTNLQQQVVESYLHERVAASPHIEMRWGHSVTAVRPHADGVTLEVDTPEGPYQLQCDWLVACDGARSFTRQALGLRMEGASYEGRFVIADIRCELDLPTERRAYFDPNWNPGNTVLMHRQPFGMWRIDYQLRPDESPEDALQPEALKARINAQLAMIGKANTPWELDWCSVYSARAMTLPEYVHGRVLFCGDAAHLLPIFGVRGANTGLQDSQNLAWKLALTEKGHAGPQLLQSYTHERVKAAREIIEEASKSTRFMTPPTAGFRLMRDAVLSLSLTEAFCRPLLNWRTSRPHEYLDSPLNSANDDNALFNAGPANGAPLRNVQLAPGHFLFDVLRAASFHFLLFTSDKRMPPHIALALKRLREQGLPITTVLVYRGEVDGAKAEVADVEIADRQGHVHAKYGVAHGMALYLARPDQHVCARWLSVDAARVERALRAALGH